MSSDLGNALADHLAKRYVVSPRRMKALDERVFRVDLDDGRSWVARVFSSARPTSEAEGDADILRRLEQAGFPAERCAAAEAVSVCEGQPVLVTEFIPGDRAKGSGRTFAVLGALLGRLHASPATWAPRGGAWHHLCSRGGPSDEIAAATSLLEEVQSRVGARQRTLLHTLVDEVERTDDCEDLPHAFGHPDFVPANAIARADAIEGDAGGGLAIIDWAGAGRGPRLWSLAFLLWAAGARACGWSTPSPRGITSTSNSTAKSLVD